MIVLPILTAAFAFLAGFGFGWDARKKREGPLVGALQRIAYGVCRSCQQAAHDARSGCDDPVWGPSDPREEARAALAAYGEKKDG